jgi:hypothetical protein
MTVVGISVPYVFNLFGDMYQNVQDVILQNCELRNATASSFIARHEPEEISL